MVVRFFYFDLIPALYRQRYWFWPNRLSKVALTIVTRACCKNFDCHDNAIAKKKPSRLGWVLTLTSRAQGGEAQELDARLNCSMVCAAALT